MKKLLLQLDSDKYASVFDQVVAYDAGVDNIIPAAEVTPEVVTDLVYGLMFTRGGSDLQNSAVFIGGSDVGQGEDIFDAVQKAFFGPVRVSVMLDSNGSNTTAAAAVQKIVKTVDVQGKKTVILAGTGPVGRGAAILLAQEGSEVVLTSRNMKRAEQAVAQIKEKNNLDVYAQEVCDLAGLKACVNDAEIIMCTGKAGVTLLPKNVWQGLEKLQVMADVNAVPPMGIEGIKVTDNGTKYGNIAVFGAIGIGNLKMKIHKAAIKKLFSGNDLVLGLKEIYELS